MVFPEFGQGHFVLRQFFEKVRISVPLSQLLGHVLHNTFYGRIPLGLEKDVVKVQLAVFHNLDTQVIQGFDRGIAGQKILGPGTECKNLEFFQAVYDPGHRNKVGDFVGHVFGRADRVFWDVRSELPQPNVVGCVQHSAESIPPPMYQVILGLLCRCHEHHRPIESLGKQGCGAFRPKIPEIDD